MSVTDFPKERIYPASVEAREMYAQQEPPQEMVWEICPYTRNLLEDSRCHHCPPSETDPNYGEMRRGCYGMAAEACRIMFAMQARSVAPPAPVDGVK